ncbi:OmpP1/FadL family transporter [Sunxiuqinia sp. A32]|uniref:OmpP1/FadL family transporter n=1 Tax=Sunxiuqinia sp. A32 TaxID=3461496 RepID=UPI004046238A
MKRTTLLVVVCVLFAQSIFAGGILTNANQSAQYVRMLSRNASTELDAVYFNPAGLTFLTDGFYFGIQNQSIIQDRTITSGFPGLNESEYLGDVKAYAFPTAFAAYKANDWAFSLGFGPNGGGGTAEYGTGIPTFEKPFAGLVSTLVQSGFAGTEYDADLYLDGSSVFWGFQLNASYQVSDILSFAAGVRYIDAVNEYQGHIQDISVTNQGVSIVDILNGLSAAATQGAQNLSAYPADMVMPDEVAASAGLPSGLTFGQGVAALTASAVQAAGTASAIDAATTNIETNTKQKGRGYTPILGANLSLDRLNVGLKYEFKTTLTLTNETEVDGTGFFPDGGQTASDIPAIFTIGADYMVTDNFKTSVSFNNYFDKAVDWRTNIYGDEKTFDHNYFEIALGLEYAITDAFKVSVGGMHSNTGVTEQYQSDFSYSNSSFTGAFGFQYQINDRLVLDAGLLYTAYMDEDKPFADPSYMETYDKKNIDFAFGIAYKLF